MSVEDAIRGFIVDEIRWNGPADRLEDDYPLIERGVIDSMGVFHLLSFLEQEFGIEVEDEDLVPETFASITSIAGLVARRMA